MGELRQPGHALANGIIDQFNTEIVNFLGPWKKANQIVWDTKCSSPWFNKKRLLSHSPPSHQQSGNEFRLYLNAPKRPRNCSKSLWENRGG